MSTNNNPKNQTEHAAAWVLRSLSTNTAWFDEMRLAGRRNFEKKYHYIPLIDISLVSENFDIATLKDACYLLKNNNDVDIYGDDFEPYGMLVQISEKGLESCNEAVYSSGKKNILKKTLTAFAAAVILATIIIGVKKTIWAPQQAKSSTPEYNKKISEANPKTTALLSIK
ncbi:MAG TPA: hypothetical protein VHZ50_15430 [Puia sp.]|jgi:hypothetical protein|nr:hypothetical protein [Puia sp.]